MTTQDFIFSMNRRLITRGILNIWRFHNEPYNERQSYPSQVHQIHSNLIYLYISQSRLEDPNYFDKHVFLCEMVDHERVRELALNFYPFDNSIQVVDLKRGKNLLRRTQMPHIKPNMLVAGNIVNIFSKLLHIVDYAPITRRNFLNNEERTFAMIKPVDPIIHGKVLTFIMKKGFRITQMKNGKLDKDMALYIYKHLKDSDKMPILIEYVTSGEVIGLELVASNAMAHWKEVLGDTDPQLAKPGTLRRMLGESILKNVAHGAHLRDEVDECCNDFFGSKNGVPIMPLRATFENCTCCVIKPHAIIDGNIGAILEHISTSGTFYISALVMFSIKTTDAMEFYEIYKGVLPEYKAMAITLSEGKCLALEVKARDPSLEVVTAFRKLCGPRDPDLCRQLYPETIRACYGKDIVENAVHCTDLPEDGVMEVEYFFRILANCKDC